MKKKRLKRVSRFESMGHLSHLSPAMVRTDPVYGEREGWLRRISRLVAIIGFIFISTTQARAGLIQDFELTGNPNFTGSGFFEFNATSGTIATNAIAYSTTFNLYGAIFNTGLADIRVGFRDIDYTIDSAWNLIFNSGIVEINPGGNPPGTNLDFFGINANILGSSSPVFTAEFECFDSQNCLFPTENINDRATIVFTPREAAVTVPVPEPATVFLIAAGLPALYWLRRRTKQARVKVRGGRVTAL